MAGGRPPKDGGAKRYPELEELASWFRQAMADAGYESPNAVVRAEIAHKNVVYGIHGASRFLKLEVVRALAVGLRRDPTEVEPLWLRAKEAADRAAAARHAAEMPRLTTWTQLPLPELALRNLLEAQSRAVERLPYDKLGVEEPPLSAVYIRQRFRASSRSGDGSARGDTRPDGISAQRTAQPGRGDGAQALDSILPVPDALARHEHLLITAEPGAGKSTLSSHVAWTLSRVWLRQESSLDAPTSEPVLPIRVAARTLVEQGGSWSGVLCQAARRSLGHSLVADPDPSLFSGRVQGARWLVMVDGLDEVADRDARTGVIRTIAQHARAGSDYRFLVTSRPLPEFELAPLRGALVGAYDLEPFGPDELRDFAHKWFSAQYEYNEERARAAADRFLKETEDGRLNELVRNPLLATIAAVNATVDRSRPLPTSRLSLYRRFCDHLLTRGASASKFRTDLNQRYRDDPERHTFHLWLDQHKRELLGVIGRCRISGAGELSEAAFEWVQEHTAENRSLPVGWQTEIQEFLQGTGLLVPDEEGYRFLHHSFAEFMAAQSYALEISPDFPDIEEWFQRAFKGDERTYAIFVFLMWSERNECAADLIVDQLLLGTWGDHERPLLAGLLLAEGVPLHEENQALILDRLEAVARNHHEIRDDAFEVLGALGGQPGVLQRLERMAAAENLNPMLRLYAVEAYSQAGAADVAEQLLSSVLGWIYGGIPVAARVACSISERARELVRRRAWAVAEEPHDKTYLLARVATALERLEQPQEVAEIARKVLAHPQADTFDLEQAAEAWIKATPAEAAILAQLALDRPAADQRGRAAVAKILAKFAEPTAAASIAEEVLSSGTSDAVALTSAADIWIKVRGAEGRSRVMKAFTSSSADLGHDVDTPAELLSSMAAFLEDTEIADWAQEVLGEHRWGAYCGGEVVSAWLAAGGAATAEQVMERIGHGRLLEAYSRADAAAAMLEVGARQEAGELAECALRTPNLSKGGYEKAAGVLLKVVSDAAFRLQSIWVESSGLDANSAWLHGVLDALREPEVGTPPVGAAACGFARELISLGTASGANIVLALDILGAFEGREVIPYIVDTVKTHSKLHVSHQCDVAKGLAAWGERAAALDVWRYVVSLSYPPQSYSELRLLMDLEAAEATQEAAGWMRELIADPSTYPPRRLRLRQMLAWLTAADSHTSADTDGLTPTTQG